MEAVYTPDSAAISDEAPLPISNRRLSARRSYSKGSSSLPQPVISILQRPVASPQRKVPDVRPPSTPLHTVKNNTPMQAPKPFNPQILKRPAQLENAANEPLPMTLPSEMASPEKEVQPNQQQRTLVGLLRGSSTGVSSESLSDALHSVDNNVHQHGVHLQQPPSQYYQQGGSTALPLAAQHSDLRHPAAEFPIQQRAVQEQWPAAHTSHHVTPPSHSQTMHFEQQKQQHQHVHIPAIDPSAPVEVSAVSSISTSHTELRKPASQTSHPYPANDAFADRRTSAAKDQRSALLGLLRPSPSTGLPRLSPPEHAIGNELVSPLDTNVKSRMSSLTHTVDNRRGSGTQSGMAEEERRGSGLSAGVLERERRESSTQTPKTPNRDFLLGFLEGVAKSAK